MNGTLTFLYLMAVSKVQQFSAELRKEERGAVDIVAIVVMIGIAVLLAVFFRKQITALLTNLFNTINTNATNAVNE